MPAETVGVLIPIIAIIMGVGSQMLKRILEHQRAMEEIKQRQGGGDGLRADIEALRHEVARLRETSTQYDLSLQNVLETVDQRVTHIETRLRQPVPTATTAPEDQQQLHVGR
ncbi:MAG TPA: hypothetical protein VGK19_23930 [Capsulimonadaceae bacterium]